MRIRLTGLRLTCVLVLLIMLAIGPGRVPSATAGDPVDVDAPVTTLRATTGGAPVDPADWQRTSVVVRLEATDTVGGVEGSGVAASYARVNSGATAEVFASGFVVIGAGTVPVEYWSVDAAGNRETTRTTTFKFDRTAPSTTSNANSLVPYLGFAPLVFGATDADSGVLATYYSIDGGPAQAGTSVALAATATIARTITYWSVDRVGNVEAPVTRTLNVLSANTPMPVTTIAGSVNDAPVDLSRWQAGDVVFTLSATDVVNGVSGPGVAFTQFQLDGSSPETYAAPVLVATEGTTTVNYWSVNTLGMREAVRTALIRIDRLPPQTRTDIPESGEPYVGEARITLTPTDEGSGATQTFFVVDGSEVQTGTTVVSTEASSTPHTLQYWSVDAAGNSEPTATAQFSVIPTEAVPPVTTISGRLNDEPVDLGQWQPGGIAFYLEATDLVDGVEGTGISATYYRVGTSTERFSTGVSVVDEGETPVQYWSVDRSGNYETTKTAIVRIDKTPPSSQATFTPRSDGVSRVQVNGLDMLSGVGRVEWSIDGERQSDVPGPGTPGPHTATLSISKPGTHTVTYRVLDGAGNADQERTVGPLHVRGASSIELTTESTDRRNTVIPIRAFIDGNLVDGQGEPLANQEVVLEYATTESFSRIKTLTATTRANGTFRFDVKLSVRTFYRARFRGGEDHQASESEEPIYVKPRAIVSMRMAPSAAPRTLYFSGTLRPLHSAGKRVLVEWATKPGGKRAGYRWATIKPREVSSSYKVKIKFPKRGVWYVRAVAPDDGAHGAAATTPVRVRIK